MANIYLLNLMCFIWASAVDNVSKNTYKRKTYQIQPNADVTVKFEPSLLQKSTQFQLNFLYGITKF